jgi:hypothetical protein
MRFGNGSARGESQARAVHLGRKEWVEQLRARLIRYANALVRNRDLHSIAVAGDVDPDRGRLALTRRGLQGVLDQSKQDVLNAQSIDGHIR